MRIAYERFPSQRAAGGDDAPAIANFHLDARNPGCSSRLED
jgi:hypothetical protein